MLSWWNMCKGLGRRERQSQYRSVNIHSCTGAPMGDVGFESIE